MTTRRAFARGAAAVLGGAVAAGSNVLPKPARAAVEPIGGTLTIGVIGPFAGDFARLAEQMEHGAQQACDETNLLQGSLQRAFTVRTFDDGDTLATSVVNAQFATQDETVVCVIGHLRAATTEAALDTYSQASMPLIVPVATADQITSQGYTNLIRLTTRDTVEGRLGARYAIKTISPTLGVGVTMDDTYGPDVVNGFVEELRRQKVDGRVSIVPLDKPDLAGIATQIAAFKPGVVYLAGKTAQLGPLIPALRAAGYAGPLMASQGMFEPQVIKTYETAVDGMIASSSMPPLAIAPSVRRLVVDYEQKYGPITPLASFAYAAAQIVITSYQATGALDRGAMLHAIKRPAVEYQTMVGDFVFENTGDPENPNLYFYQVTNGAWKYRRAAHPSGFLIE